MKLPPDLEARVLELAGVKPAPKSRVAKPVLVAESFAPATACRGPVWVVPLATVSEANRREWRGRSSRTREARLVVTRALGRHLAAVVPYAEAYHRGEPVRVTLTRIGGRTLDALANLGSALKAVEDAVALVMGADDGSPLWKPTCDQEPGGPCGVRIELEIPA